MEQPSLPPVVAGKSALPAFLAIEAWARETTVVAEAAAAERLEAARAEAQRVRTEGEQALRDAVIDAERDALRDVETRARDRVSEARIALNRWVDQAEATAIDLLGEAVARICGS